MLIDFIFDPVCPWCYIGKRRLEGALALRPGAEAAIRWRPFLLNPEMPPEGIDRTAYLIKKFGSEARVSRVYGAINETGQSVEIDFEFDDISHTPSSVNAHRLVRFAERSGKGAEAVEALFFAYFIETRNIGQTEVLASIGADLGLDAQEVSAYLAGDDDVVQIYQENAGAHRLGINGVPAFVFNDRMAVSGAQEPPVLARVIDAALAAERAA